MGFYLNKKSLKCLIMVKKIVVSGYKDANGVSWCPDCVTYEPVVRKVMEELEDDRAVYIYCLVGDRAYWKDRNNEFRKDPKLKLSGVPTFLKYGSQRKLVEDQLCDEMLALVFEED